MCAGLAAKDVRETAAKDVRETAAASMIAAAQLSAASAAAHRMLPRTNWTQSSLDSWTSFRTAFEPVMALG